jgi:heat shock protein 4
LGGTRVADVVIGCPVWWTDAQRRAMLDAANIAGLNVLRLINETTAVALYYAMSRTERKEERRVMFIDVGHAGTQISVVKFEAEQLTVLASGGDRNLGGRNFDEMLIEHFGAYIQQKYKMDVLSNTKARGKLAKECTKVKHMLSANIKVPFNVEYIMNDRDVSGVIERPEFEALANKEILPRLLSAVKAVLDKAGLKPADLTSVEVVGGGVRVPCILKR